MEAVDIDPVLSVRSLDNERSNTELSTAGLLL